MDKNNIDKNMDKNNNKSFSITRYAFQSFRYYGGKSIIFMIALAAVLILALFNIMTSIQRTMELSAVSEAGDAHFQFLNVTPEQIDEVKKLKEVEWAGEYVSLRHITANLSDKTAWFAYIESLGKMDGFKITEGKFPEKENEVALSPYAAEYLGIEAKVGVEFEAETVGLSADDAQTVRTPVKFIVSGIVQDNDYFKKWEIYYLYVSKDFINANAHFEASENNIGNITNDSRDVLVKLKKGYDAEKTAPLLAQAIGLEQKNIMYNYSYLYASLNGKNNQIVFGVIIAFFMLVGALIIYNAFNIIIAKRTRHFGLLTLLGASKKQIRKCVYIEALMNATVALPLGLLLGTLISRAVMPLVSSMTTETTVYYVAAWSYILTVLMTVLTVAVGSVIPARRAGKITPVEAAKFSSDSARIRKNPKKIKTLSNITLTVLSRINLFRRKGVGGIIVSLSIVGVLFIGLAVIMFSMYSSAGNLARQSYASDIRVTGGVKDGNSIISKGGVVLPENIVREIENIDGVKNFHAFYRQYYREPELSPEGQMLYGSILGVDDEIMSEYLKYAESTEGNLALKDFTDKSNKSNVFALNDRNRSGINYEYSPGGDITMETADFSDENYESRTINLHVAGTTDWRNLPSYINAWGPLPTLVMPVSSFEANNFDTLNCYGICFDIDESKYDSIAASLDKICASEGNIHYESYIEQKKDLENQMMNIIALIFAGLGVVLLVSILNLVSTTLIGIEQRKRELGILSALGLGRKELKKMLKWEGIWVSVFSTVISIIGGCGVGYLFYLWIENMGGDYINLSFPVIPAIIFCLIYIFAPYIITSVAVKKLLKNTMVELIGQEI